MILLQFFGISLSSKCDLSDFAQGVFSVYRAWEAGEAGEAGEAKSSEMNRSLLHSKEPGFLVLTSIPRNLSCVFNCEDLLFIYFFIPLFK